MIVPGPLPSITLHLSDFLAHSAGGRKFDLRPLDVNRGVTRGEVIEAISELYHDEYTLAKKWQETETVRKSGPTVCEACRSQLPSVDGASMASQKQKNTSLVDVSARAFAALRLEGTATYNERLRELRPTVRRPRADHWHDEKVE